MNVAVMFQKYGNKPFWGLFRKIHHKLFLRKNSQRIKYLRDAGAKIGRNCTIFNTMIFGSEPYLIEIGDNTYFSGSETRIFTHDGSAAALNYMGFTEKQFDIFGKVKIGSNCFIGHNVTIMKNVVIGDNCIIGAGAVVTKDIPNGSVAAGSPARVICTVEEYYLKIRDNLCDTVGWNTYKKRCYLENKLTQ